MRSNWCIDTPKKQIGRNLEQVKKRKGKYSLSIYFSRASGPLLAFCGVVNDVGDESGGKWPITFNGLRFPQYSAGWGLGAQNGLSSQCV